ncbi:MAG: PHP domain-containing protein [Planctomycetaceae bacterium]|nr:PHP domain-containing protein [Planctomycetaceae bacterium]
MLLFAGCREEADAPQEPVRPYFIQRVPWAETGVWLKADLHVHSKFSDGSHSITELAAAAVRNGCDVLAVTDHADHDRDGASAEYFAELDAARRRHPELILFAGLEWNVPPYGGDEHAAVIAPINPTERSLLSGFKARFDDYGRHEKTKDPELATAAIGWLHSQSRSGAGDLPVVIYHHPGRKRAHTMSLVDEMVKLREAGSVVVGFEGAPGHQRGPVNGAYDQRLKTIDRWDTSAANVGDAWDELTRRGHHVSGAIASSDFHNRENANVSDYLPGEFSETWLFAPARSSPGVLAALRAGTTFAAHGHVVRQVQLKVSAPGLPRPAIGGEILRIAAGTPLTIQVDLIVPDVDWQGATNTMDEVELILISSSSARPLRRARLSNRGASSCRHTLTSPDGAWSVRARGRRVVADGPDLLFYTNPVHVLSQSDSLSTSGRSAASLKSDDHE